MLSGHQAMVIAVTMDGAVYHYPHCAEDILKEAQALAARPRASYGPYTWEVYEALATLDASPISRYEINEWASSNASEDVNYWMGADWEALVAQFGEPLVQEALAADEGENERAIEWWLYNNISGSVHCDACGEEIE